LSHHFSCTPGTLWKALLDEVAWTEWLDMSSAEWTSALPFGVGTTRTVKLPEHQINEVFVAWEDDKRMAFRFDQSTLPVKAAAEDYRILQTEQGCELQWTLRVSAIFPVQQLVFRQIRRTLAAGLPKLASLIAKNPVRFS